MIIMKNSKPPKAKELTDPIDTHDVCKELAASKTQFFYHFGAVSYEPLSAAFVFKRLQPEQIQELIDDLQEYLRLQDDNHFFL